MKKVLFGLMLIMALNACSEKVSLEDVRNSKWVLSEWPGKSLPTTKKATLNFGDESKVSGKSFCNGFGGNVTINADTVKFDQLLGTMMYCEDVGDAEKKFLDDLKATNSFEIKDDKLHLFQGNQLLMVFSKTN